MRAKHCGRCGKHKPVSEFHRNKTRKGGYANRCKVCCKAHKRAPNAICLTCSARFYATSSSFGKYCSIECSAKSRDRKVSVMCPTCGNTFRTFRYKSRYSEGKYCSRSCAMRARRGEHCAAWKGGEVLIVCKNCGRFYPVKPYRENEAQFCSLACKGDWQSRHIRGSRHPNWKGGPVTYPPEWTRKFRRSIRKRDGHSCARCGKKGAKEVHHIDYTTRTVPENCITLCNPCHSQIRKDRLYWWAVLSALAEFREER